MNELTLLVKSIAEVGRKHPLCPPVAEIAPFQNFFISGKLDNASLDQRDGGCTRRELMARMLLLNAVLDQGPDIVGVREMMVAVANKLYEDEIRIFHRPLDFFKELHVSVDEIWHTHEGVKTQRAHQWAEVNQTTPTKYNLYMDNSKQTLNYAIFRWGVPLALPYLLGQKNETHQDTALIDYLESFESAEQMSQRLKDHNQYGLGKAIGDKACHLFAKWLVSSFQLIRKDDKSWGEFSYEVPYDSNVGRVLWRTGYLTALASLDQYKGKDVVQTGSGKGGKHYIRVTNIRAMKVSVDVPSHLSEIYADLCLNYLKSHKQRPQKIEIQRFQHALLYAIDDPSITVADFDDGLIEIGRNYCFNHQTPNCGACPINAHCRGYQAERSLIDDYRT